MQRTAKAAADFRRSVYNNHKSALKNQRNTMGTGTTISIIIAVVAIILTIFFYMNDSLDKRVEKAINHPDFIKKVAEYSKLPMLIFNEDGTYQSESADASLLISKIEPFTEKIERGKERFAGFIVYPSQFLNSAPILQAINSKVVFSKAKKINTIDWKYRIPEWNGSEWGGSYDEPPEKLYKIEIIK
ncbi:hypothetical protein [Desulforhopalus sp. IMCC35007]|uniref:hypothetical protein n=1 Tax=Desulforhopalus sp. IMCC35007 TaxID=2569543 RepID=UPI00145EA6F7|nr:hypothetical protein [Desulforhopalus sp. IMCC35007]